MDYRLTSAISPLSLKGKATFTTQRYIEIEPQRIEEAILKHTQLFRGACYVLAQKSGIIKDIGLFILANPSSQQELCLENRRGWGKTHPLIIAFIISYHSQNNHGITGPALIQFSRTNISSFTPHQLYPPVSKTVPLFTITSNSDPVVKY